MANGHNNAFQMVIADIELSFAILPSTFPLEFFTKDDVGDIILILQNLINRFPNGERRPRIVHMEYEAGYCKVIAGDRFTKNWIIENVSTLTFIEKPLMVTSQARIPSCIYSTRILGAILDDAIILSRLNKQNEHIKTELWVILEKYQVGN